MPERPGGRRRKKDDDDNPGPQKETVDLNSQEHAWWANREELDSQRIPTGRTKKPVEEAPKKSVFNEYYSTESLFVSTPEDLFEEDDPYAVLGVPPSATWEQITRAHRALAKRFHPDRLVPLSAGGGAKGEAPAPHLHNPTT